MKDFFLAGLIGLGVGFCVLPFWANIGRLPPVPISAAIVAGFIFLGLLAFAIFRFGGRFWAPLEQVGKFAAVGSLNTFLDLGIVNLLILLTSVAAGWTFSLFKAAGFLLAATNSYFWNKFWTFQSRTPADWREYSFLVFLRFPAP